MYRFSKVVRGKDARRVPLQSEGWRICPLWILNSVSSVMMSLRKSRGVPLGLLTSSPFSFSLGFTRFTRCFVKSCTLWTFSLGVSCFSIFTGVWHWRGHRAWSLCCFNVFFHIMCMKTWPLGLWCDKRATGPDGADAEPLEETEAPGKSTHYHDAQKLIALV